jgi:hypothetical protein
MAVIKYSVKENKTLGTHSYYAQAVSFSTLEFQDLADEVVEGLGITPELVNTILTRYMRVAKRNVLRGHRVKFGDLLTIYPQISCSVKDEVDDNGNIIKVATADMLNVASAKGSIGATISQAVQLSFAQSVSWKRSNETTSDDGGNPDDDTPTDTGVQQPSNGSGTGSATQQNQNNNNGGGTQTGGGTNTNTGGGTQQSGGGSTQQQGQPGDYRLVIYKYGDGTAAVTDEGGNTIESNAQVASGSTINLSVVSVDNKRPCIRINGTIQYIVNENNGAWTGSFQMPTKATTLEILTDPDDDDFADEN